MTIAFNTAPAPKPAAKKIEVDKPKKQSTHKVSKMQATSPKKRIENKQAKNH